MALHIYNGRRSELVHERLELLHRGAAMSADDNDIEMLRSKPLVGNALYVIGRHLSNLLHSLLWGARPRRT